MKKYETAVPSRISVAGVILILADIRMMRPAGISAPRKALETIPSSPATPANDTPTMMAATAPKHAPEDMPVL